MIVSEVKFENKEIKLCSKDYDKDKNVFTIIVGRNGAGKSRLFQKIIHLAISSLLSQSKHHFRIQDLYDYYEQRDITGLDETGCLTLSDGNTYQKILITKPVFIPPNIDLSQIPEHLHERVIESLHSQYIGSRGPVIKHILDGSPQEKIENFPKVIAVSSSPFDKFPILDEKRIRPDLSVLGNHYLYRGARTKDRSSKSYMRSKFDQLGASFVNFFLKPKTRTNELQPLFSYLGIKTKFTVFLKFPDHFSFEDILSDRRSGPIEAVRSVRFFKGKEPYENLTDEDMEIILANVKTLYDGLYSDSKTDVFHRREKVFPIELDIDNSTSIEPKFLEEFSVLASYDLVDLANIEFTKDLEDRKFFLTEASSGELCILFNILAIAGSISDNSIVLLDEPELSLHPEWQRDFLPLIQNMFSSYKSCHFIIATHSPSIVSSIPSSNSFVVNLENNPADAVGGEEYAFKSSDYQLAETFNSPGYKNEYLIRQLVGVLSKLSEGKKLDSDFYIKISNLIEFESLIDEGDPVKKLLSTLKKALEVLERE
ncbi:AAA family ATPase [Vibrio cholerae]|nr:ATP-binding protein [Vibrio cholerae]EJL6422789.1 ATP-binding protein [Vibrio cholerae]HEJ2461002.1 ATP-binding protein [Vibrio cholerae]